MIMVFLFDNNVIVALYNLFMIYIMIFNSIPASAGGLIIGKGGKGLLEIKQGILYIHMYIILYIT